MISGARHLARRALAAVSLLLLPAMAAAQVQAGIEVARERATYHFDNPSTFNTTALVPHFFEQHYVLDNVWLNIQGRYRFGVDMETSFGATPTTQALATDYDTFFNPDGVVWVAGTTGDARTRSWRLGQSVRLGRARGVRLTGGYRLRVDNADFLDGDRTVVRDGLAIERSVVTTREYTTAQRHEIFVGARGARVLTPAWRVEISGDVSPAAIHRLAIELPDKYPGRTLVYKTTAMTAQGRLEVVRAWSRWTLAIHAGAGGTWNYHGSQRVSRTTVVGGLTVGR